MTTELRTHNQHRRDRMARFAQSQGVPTFATNGLTRKFELNDRVMCYKPVGRGLWTVEARINHIVEATVSVSEDRMRQLILQAAL